ncbi:methyltransferase domain-containing protein [Desulfosporosinus fructosivorans]|uniref:Methyltransferase domain-containing protein n=2 Tax=Desulfosporosinus fructosivorans TaxID=2018669 RepID=A0A4Z0R8T1_9FIRM|nr:methyltransferase domain-containing protein [Desulfosporosinus fructosivorans]
MWHNPEDVGPQYLEDLATGYWFSEVLFTAIELDVFTLLESEGMTTTEIAGVLDMPTSGLGRFLQALCAIGLVVNDGERYYNTKLASDYIVLGKSNYQGDSILWRKGLKSEWQNLTECLRAGGRVNFPVENEGPEQFARRIRKYIDAMDNIARTKVAEILPFFEGLELNGKILDIGTGSGAIASGFLERFPSLSATVVDIQEVLNYTRELMNKKGFGQRVSYVPANILEPWPVAKGGFDLVILSNIIHAYSEEEIPLILDRAANCLKSGGFLIIHDFFPEHFTAKAALLDLNMFINTYNGRIFSGIWVREQLAMSKLYTTELIPLATDTALIFAAKDETLLANLRLDERIRLIARIKGMGFERVLPIDKETIHVADWTDLRCQYGCDRYGQGHCPPNSPTPEKTRNVLRDFSHALLIEGEPPGKMFQSRVLAAEREAFLVGFHKAFAYWAGPCVLCNPCALGVNDGTCRNTRDARPSMEGAGIDVYETVKRAGLDLKILRNKGEFVRYFALLLLE